MNNSPKTEREACLRLCHSLREAERGVIEELRAAEIAALRTVSPGWIILRSFAEPLPNTRTLLPPMNMAAVMGTPRRKGSKRRAGRARRATGRPERRWWATVCQAAERAGKIGAKSVEKTRPKSARQIVEGRSANSPRSGVAIFFWRAKTRPILWGGRVIRVVVFWMMRQVSTRLEGWQTRHRCSAAPRCRFPGAGSLST